MTIFSTDKPRTIMARVKNNLLLEGLSGRLGSFLIKNYPSGPVISKIPDRSRVKLSKKQKALNKRFQEAVKYAQSVMRDKALQKKYATGIKQGKSLYHLALSDYLRNHR